MSPREFWQSLSEDQQQKIIRYERSGLGTDPTCTPRILTDPRGTLGSLHYIWSTLNWAISEHDYDLCDRLIEQGNSLYHAAALTDRHFFLSQAISCYYKQREVREDALPLCEKYCLEDMRLFPEYKQPLFRELHSDHVRIPSFIQLAILYEKGGRYQEAIDVCRLAQSYGLSDWTKSGYDGRIKRIMKKVQK